MSNYLAQIDVGPVGCTIGALCNSSPGDAGNQFGLIITAAIGILTIVAFIWFAFQVIIGAYSIISAGGDKGKVTEGQKKITNGITGVVVVVSAIFIVRIVGFILGVNTLDNFTQVILDITP